MLPDHALTPSVSLDISHVLQRGDNDTALHRARGWLAWEDEEHYTSVLTDPVQILTEL